MAFRFFGHGEDVQSPETKAQEVMHGSNVKTVIEFARHEQPGKLPDGMSADYITPEGQQKAAETGKRITEPKVKAYSSPKLRAQETADLSLQNVDESVGVINQKLTEDLKGKVKGQKPENAFVMRIRPELDTARNFGVVNEAGKAWEATAKAERPGLKGMDFAIQYLLDHPEFAQANNASTPDELAENIAYAAAREIGMTAKLRSDSDVRLRNLTHGPNLEPFMQRVMVKPDGTHGFKNLEEIGGMVQPGEGFELLAVRDGQGQLSVKLKFRGQEYAVDMEKLNALAEARKKRIGREPGWANREIEAEE